jgi:hypothetical protein
MRDFLRNCHLPIVLDIKAKTDWLAKPPSCGTIRRLIFAGFP